MLYLVFLGLPLSNTAQLLHTNFQVTLQTCLRIVAQPGIAGTYAQYPPYKCFVNYYFEFHFGIACFN